MEPVFQEFSRRIQHIEEHVEEWTYLKFPYLKAIGWQGIKEGKVVMDGKEITAEEKYKLQNLINSANIKIKGVV